MFCFNNYINLLIIFHAKAWNSSEPEKTMIIINQPELDASRFI